jgi:hypothetical protein
MGADAGMVLGPDQRSVVRVVVLSDIHATDDQTVETNVARATAGDERENALSGAKVLLESEIGEADLLLCPGDLVHRGETGLMEWVWKELHAIAGDLGATLVATAGNHGMLREPEPHETPSDALRDLEPKFPYQAPQCVDAYWGHDLAIVESGDWRIVSLNSCGQHGGFNQSENDHGRLRKFCLKELEDRLGNSDAKPSVNICMTHHHPQEWSHEDDAASSHMEQGDRLIEMLDARPERWMLLHGHKHHSVLDYFGNGSSGPVRLSAGSVGASLLEDVGPDVGNQMHVVEFHIDAISKGLLLAGEVKSFDWVPGEGWELASAHKGLPRWSQFGYRRDGHELATKLLERAKAEKRRTWSWREILEMEEGCAYLSPRDREELFAGVKRLGGGIQQGSEPSEFLEVTFAWA